MYVVHGILFMLSPSLSVWGLFEVMLFFVLCGQHFHHKTNRLFTNNYSSILLLIETIIIIIIIYYSNRYTYSIDIIVIIIRHGKIDILTIWKKK